MADHGDGNIKVVVRCRPLNARGESVFHASDIIFPCSHEIQSSRAVQSHSFVCPETKHFWIRPSLVLPKRRHHRVARQNARRWGSPLTRVTGPRVPVTSQATAHSKRSSMTSERSCWIMDLPGSMHVFWPVSFAIALRVNLFDTAPKMGRPVRAVYAFLGYIPTLE